MEPLPEPAPKPRPMFITVDLGTGKGSKHISLAAVESILMPKDSLAIYTINLLNGRSIIVDDANGELGELIDRYGIGGIIVAQG